MALKRVAIVLAYVAVFWLALPAALWRAAGALDAALGAGGQPRPAGLAIAGLGVALMAWGMAALWRQGGGLAVSALPPPRLARGGPYALVRHPIYLGFNLAVLGAGLSAGSPSLAFVLAPLVAPAWIAYARLEERGLRRRFGRAYGRYAARVGLFPRVRFYAATRLAGTALLPWEAEGAERLPAEGAAVLVANHACYLDPVYLGVLTPRRIHFLATAEAYRSTLLGAYCRRMHTVPVRRYRSDPAACREMVRLLDEGELVGVFVEGERSVLGEYQGAQPQVAGVLARLGAPVYAVGIAGSYDCGPRWAGVLRRRPVRLRVAGPLRWGGPAAAVIDAALEPLIGQDPQSVHLAGLPLARIERVLWRCPRCADAGAWRPADLSCAACGIRYRPDAEGFLEGDDGRRWSLAALGRAVLSAAEAEAIAVRASGWREVHRFGPPLPMQPMGAGVLVADPGGLRFGSLSLDLAALRSISTERADTLQVATCDAMWQFRVASGSVFRLQAALRRWMRAGEAPADAGRRVACR